MLTHYFIAVYVISHWFKGASPPKKKARLSHMLVSWGMWIVGKEEDKMSTRAILEDCLQKEEWPKKTTQNDLLLYSVSGPTELKSLAILGNPLCYHLRCLAPKGKGESFE